MKNRVNLVVLLGVLLSSAFAAPSLGQDGKSPKKTSDDSEHGYYAAKLREMKKARERSNKVASLVNPPDRSEVKDIVLYLLISDVQELVELTDSQKQKTKELEEDVLEVLETKRKDKTKSIKRICNQFKKDVLRKGQRDSLLVYHAYRWMYCKGGDIETLVESSRLFEELKIPKSQLPTKETLLELKAQEKQALADVRKKYRTKLVKLYPNKASKFFKRLAETPRNIIWGRFGQ